MEELVLWVFLFGYWQGWGGGMERGNSRFERGMVVGNHVDGWEIIG